MTAQRGQWRGRLRRWLPSLVWIGDEIGVRVTFPENRLQRLTTDDHALEQLRSGALPEIEARFAALGIEFDTGLGPEGRELGMGPVPAGADPRPIPRAGQ